MGGTTELKLSANEVYLGNVHFRTKENFKLYVTEGKDLVDYHSSECGCTKVSYNQEEGYFDITLDVFFAIGEKQLKQNEYDCREKYVDIYIDKGESEFIAHPVTKKRRRNENKRSIRFLIKFCAHG